MSTYTTNASSRPLFGTVFAALSGVLESAAQYRQYRQTVTALNSLSYKELDDLGLNRGTIKSTARTAVYGA